MMLALICFLAIVAIDQLTKYYIWLNLLPGESIPIIEDIFHLTYVLNPGAAFGVLSHQKWIFYLVATIFLGVIVRYYPVIRKSSKFLHYGAIILAGGAVGNLIDRLNTGLVVDFFDFRIWPVFNIADIAIIVGVTLIIWAIFVDKEELFI